MPTQTWSLEQTKQLYAIQQWGDGYFSVNDQGHVCVKPQSSSKVEIDLFEVAEALKSKGLNLPVLIRFTDILPDRIHRLQLAFDSARVAHAYQGHYTPVYPIKVNQQGNVVEAIVSADNIGLEAGSKPELLAILGLAKPGGTIVCNGYKDRMYIRMALMGQLMGLSVFIVIEKPSELELILEEAGKLQVKPLIGLRVRLSTISAGKWQNSGGEKSKFGLHANEVLQLLDRLRQANMLDCLQLMHFHMGSQIANIHDIKLALKEAGQFYRQLRELGANITTVDAGGGLGVDYDGSGSRRECSINYSMREYADNIARAFAETARDYDLPQPNIITESGRAITAHHAVLITNVTEVESLKGSRLTGRFTNVSEAYHNAQFDMAEARARFVQGDIGLADLAEAEKRYVGLCQQIQSQLNPDNHHHREILQELDEKLADKVFCNFSLFQSMPDIWGIDQIFPIMPIHRLDEQPTRRAVLQDLTCDSDGRIDQYVDRQNISNTLPLHAISAGDDYLIGFFMVGAYQEILGDMHNLFGDTHSINVELDANGGYRFGEFMEGEDVSELLDYVHIDTAALKTAYRNKLAQASLTQEQRQNFEQELLAGLNAYTYLEK